MTNIRLTNAIRDKIKMDMLQYKFNDKNETIKDLRAGFRVLADEAYNTILSEKDIELMNSLPEGWLSTSDRLNISSGTYDSYYLFFDGSFSHLVGLSYSYRDKFGLNSTGTANRILPNNIIHKYVKIDSNTSDIFSKYTKLSREAEKLGETINKASRSIAATLASFTTYKTLVEGWPEAKPFIDAIVGNPSKVKSTAVVVQTSEINKLIGLPV